MYFWCHFVPWVMPDSENVSFVIFQNSVCPPYWSKWTTVFSLLLLENLSNSSQNCLRWSLDWAEQNLLNIIFWPLVKKKVMMFWTTTSTQNWFGGCNLGQTLINRNETWYASSKPRSEVNTKVGNSATYGYWDSKMSHILLITIDDLLVIVITSKLTNFGVSRTNSIAPPPVQIFNIEIIITHKPLILGK